jgi:hypothetical protein
MVWTCRKSYKTLCIVRETDTQSLHHDYTYLSSSSFLYTQNLYLFESNPKTYYEHRMSYLAFYRKLQLQEVYELDGETRDIEPLGATVHKPSLSRLFSTQRSAPAQFTYNQKAVTETLMFWTRLTQKERSRRPCEGRGKGAEDKRKHSEYNHHNQPVKPNLHPRYHIILIHNSHTTIIP